MATPRPRHQLSMKHSGHRGASGRTRRIARMRQRPQIFVLTRPPNASSVRRSSGAPPRLRRPIVARAAEDPHGHSTSSCQARRQPRAGRLLPLARSWGPSRRRGKERVPNEPGRHAHSGHAGRDGHAAADRRRHACRADTGSRPSPTASRSEPAVRDGSISSSTTRPARCRSRTSRRARPQPTARTTSTTRRSARLILNRRSAGVLKGSFVIESSRGLPALLLELPRHLGRGLRPRHPLHERGVARLRVPPGGLLAAADGQRRGRGEAGVVVALDVRTGKHRPIYGMGRHNHENSVRDPGLRRAVVLSGDDTFTSGPAHRRAGRRRGVPAQSQLYSYIAPDTNRSWPTRATSTRSSPTPRA